jgi:magnesium transporter
MEARPETKPDHPGRPFARVIRRFVRFGAKEETSRLLDRMHPADVVQVLKELRPAERRDFVDVLMGHARAGAVLAELPHPQAVEILSNVSDERIAALVSRQAPDEAADLLGLLAAERADAVLKLLDERTAANLDRLMTYGKESAGGMMTTHFLALEGTTRVSDAITRIREKPEAEMVFYLYVIDSNGRLEGVVSLRQLVLARPDVTLSSIMNSRVTQVRTDVPRAEVADLITRYNLLAVPVVDASNALVGIVTVDDAIDAIADETTREMYRMAGLNTEDSVTSPVRDSVRRRLGWMLINLATAILASWVVWLFEGSIAQVVALATFMPIVAGMGGNGATQALTVVIRGIAVGEFDFSSARRVILKEILVGIAIGAATGTVMAVVAVVWKGNAMMGLVIGLAMIINLFVAGFAGAAIPIALKWFGIDPAMGSGVIVTTFTDCFGFLSFLGLGTLLLAHLH